MTKEHSFDAILKKFLALGSNWPREWWRHNEKQLRSHKLPKRCRLWIPLWPKEKILIWKKTVLLPLWRSHVQKILQKNVPQTKTLDSESVDLARRLGIGGTFEDQTQKLLSASSTCLICGLPEFLRKWHDTLTTQFSLARPHKSRANSKLFFLVFFFFLFSSSPPVVERQMFNCEFWVNSWGRKIIRVPDYNLVPPLKVVWPGTKC